MQMRRQRKCQRKKEHIISEAQSLQRKQMECMK